MPDSRHDAAGESETFGADLAWLKQWTRRQSGIMFQENQKHLFHARVDTLCREVNLRVDQLREEVQRGDQRLALRLIDAVTTNYTYFFRETSSFRLVRDRLRGELVDEEEVRLWAAATASGEEAYSLAIVAHEALGPGAVRVRILGTDISERQVASAEAGFYSREQLANVGPERLARWFRPAASGGAEVVPELRARCTFRRLNLLRHPWPFTRGFHMIFLRNVLYYFAAGARRQVIEACYDAASPGGYLVTSLTEPMAARGSRWLPVVPGVFRRGQT